MRLALRRLRRRPGFTAAALLTLALGIGANALIFSVVNAVFLRPLSYRDAGRLVWVTEFYPRFNRSQVPAPDFAAWSRQSARFERLEAMGPTIGTNVTSVGRPAERAQTAHVTRGFFSMIGIQPRLGRAFDTAGPPSEEAVISDAFWRGFFGADPRVIGKSIALDGKPRAIVGVMPPGFVYPDGADTALWLPDAAPLSAFVASGRPRQVRLIGRLKSGATIEQARAELERIARGMDNQYPAPFHAYHAAATVRVVSLQRQLTADSETAAVVLMGAVGFLLLIACANVANLVLARAVARRKEIAVRMALGAARGDIVRLLLSENVLLGACGGALGIALLVWGRGAVEFLMPKALAQGIAIDWRVLAFTAACSLAAGLLFGAGPALVASRVNVNSGLKEIDESGGGRLPACLAAGQIALSVVLLAGAGLLIRSFLLLASTNPGFDARGVLVSNVMLRPAELYKPEREAEFCDRLLSGVRRLPGVQYAAVTSAPPIAQFSALESGIRTDDGPAIPDTVSINSVSGQFFQTLGIRLVAGRFFDERDTRTGEPAVIVNQTLAGLLFAGRDPLGHRIGAAKVVGVVADTRHRALDDNVWPEVFLPFDQSPSPWITVLVRGAGDPWALAAPVRGVAQAIDPSQPVFDVELLERKVSASMAERCERAAVFATFAVLALLIAVVGIYGVISYSVVRRTREIALRMALGAGRRDVMRMVVGGGLRLAACGMAVGLAGAMAVTRVLASFLYRVAPTDGITFGAVFAVLAAAAFLASYLPARRAAAVEPMAALRRE